MNALLVVGLVLALMGAQGGPAVFSLDELLPKLFGPQIMALLALIAADVLLGVALAIRQGVFEWRKLSDFYLKMVIPYLIGWVAFAILAKFAGNGVLGPTYGDMAAEGVTGLAWLAIVATMGSRIGSCVKELYGELAPFKAKG